MKKVFIVCFVSFLIMGCREKTVSPDVFTTAVVTGSIIIHSEPEGARIKRNGVLTLNTTPDTISNLSPGIYNISLISVPGRIDSTFDVYLQEGEELFYYIELKRRELD